MVWILLVQIEMYATIELYIEHEDGGVNSWVSGMLKESELLYLADPFDVFAEK